MGGGGAWQKAMGRKPEGPGQGCTRVGGSFPVIVMFSRP